MNELLEDIKPELKIIVGKIVLKHGKAALLAAVAASEGKVDDEIAKLLLPSFEQYLQAMIEKA